MSEFEFIDGIVFSEDFVKELAIDEENWMRRAIFTLPDTKQKLHDWIELYLRLDFPDAMVDPSSNCSPMDMIWETYNHARLDDDPDFYRVLYYSSRGGYKTLGASVLEFLMAFLLQRDVAHMAAIIPQSLKAQQYLKKFSTLPIIREFVTGRSQRRIEFTRPDTGAVNYIQVIACTMAGCIDLESRIQTPNGYELAKNIKSGDSISTVDYLTGEKVFVPVRCVNFTEKFSRKINLDNGAFVVVSEDHKIFTDSGWKSADTLMLGDKILFDESSPVDSEYTGTSESLPPSPATLEQLLLGTVLGDASVSPPGTGNPYYSVAHGPRQLTYLLWIRDQLERNGIVCRLYPHPTNGSTKLITKRDNMWKRYRSMFYGESGGPKRITYEILEKLTIEGVAYWMMDDCRGNARHLGKYKDHPIELATCAFSHDENVMIANWFGDKFGLPGKVVSIVSGGKEYEIIRWSLEHSRRLSDLLSPYFVPALRYKLLPSVERTYPLCIDCGKVVPRDRRVTGFTSCCRSPHKTRLGRKEMSQIRSRCTRNVTSIEQLPKKVLVDFVMDTNLHRLKSFLVNGILCHNSNFEHVPFMVIDEVDVVAHPDAYEEAKFIPAPMNGHLPITLLTSTRKFSFGLVQKEIDEADRTGLLIRHWNVLDTTQRCAPERHLPDLPKIPIYRNDKTLRSISEAEFMALPQDKAADYVRDEGFVGCLQNCPIFAACKSRLATHQKSTSKLLKPLAFTISEFKTSSPDKARAQLLCWKPSKEGLIYTTLDPDVHYKTAAQIAEMVDGIERPATFGKADLLRWAAQMIVDGVLTLPAGVDFGFTHNHATVLALKDNQGRAFVIDVLAVAEMELDQTITLTEERVRPFGENGVATLYPDNAYPAYIKTYRRRGFRCVDFKKDVMGGIEAVRYGLMDGAGVTRLFFLKGDEGVELLWTRLSQYHWKLDASGRPTGEPDDELDDECFTDETEVLTGGGWKSLGRVVDTDTVAAVTADGRLLMETPARVIHKPYTGEMVSVRHPHLEFSATIGHRHAVMTQMDWKVRGKFNILKRTVEEMATESYWPTNIPAWPEGSGVFDSGPDEAWVAGMWLADGCVDHSRPSFLILDQTKLSIIEKIRDTLARLGWTYSETCDKRCKSVRFVISGQKERVSSWLRMFGEGSFGKRLDVKTILLMTHLEREALWDGYMCGDGSRTGSFWHFDSISPALIDGIQILTLSLNYGCRIVSYDSMAAGRKMTNPYGNTYTAQQSYRGHVLRRRPATHLSRNLFTFSEVQDLTVHCVNTSTGFFLARTNGKVFVAGNCDAARYLCQNIFTQRKGVVISTQQTAEQHIRSSLPVSGQQTYDNYLAKIVRDELSKKGGIPGVSKGKRGGLVWNIGDDSDEVVNPLDIVRILDKDLK